MKRYSALIIDDENIARFNLTKKLSNFSEIDIVGEASGITSAIKAIEPLKPDLLFLDIQLSDGNGFDLLDKIDYNGKIIFVTAYDESDPVLATSILKYLSDLSTFINILMPTGLFERPCLIEFSTSGCAIKHGIS